MQGQVDAKFNGTVAAALINAPSFPAKAGIQTVATKLATRNKYK